MNTPIPDEMRKQAAIDATKAAKALDRGDWKAALKLLASAVQMDPFRAETIALLDRALDEAGSKAESFIKKGGTEETWVGFQGIKAYAAHRRGDFKTALSELKDLTQNFDTNFFPEAWGLDWLTEDAIRAAEAVALEFLAVAFHKRYPEPDQLTAWSREQFGRAIAALERVEAVLGADDRTLLFKGQMLSKAGRFAEAIAVTEKAANENPTFRTATAAAMANKRAGGIERAVQWFWRASELDPKNETCLLDIGDTYAERGEWQKSLAAYETAMKRVPNHDWAYPSAVYCRYRITGDRKLLEELWYMANAAPDECGMASMMKQMFGGYNFEDRRHRAEFLMREIEPDFEPTPREHDHDEDEK